VAQTNSASVPYLVCFGLFQSSLFGASISESCYRLNNMKNPFDMSNDELRAEVAAFMGWKFPSDTKALPHVAWCLWSPPNQPEWNYCQPPEYTKSLDACSEFEKTITKEQFNRYIICLIECLDSYEERDRYLASPVHRCMAFILVKQFEIEVEKS
jgi:hypothetical protein